MFEVRIHGRGGQGVRRCAQILGRAAYLSGFYTQDFAIYGAERRGAPVTAFVRYSRNKIMTRGYIFEPDALIILDDLLDFKKILSGLKKGGIVLLNTGNKPKFLKKMKRVYWLDALKIALDTIGRPIPNSAVLGAFSKIIKSISIGNMKKAFEIEFSTHDKKIIEKNNEAMQKGYEMVKKCLR